ncbi:uncharacterized protein LOC125474767 [Pyrus x bretschneideri]|uniref:uncharacterized protein LOC125474767 n=1 Tax=Pyrus x bretschneideri TaxID=225117 RepID=UPI00202E15AB|nr:uncharacterized protein LOC125474767 [Pyrus x bretschneideri]
MDAKIHLEAGNLGETIKEDNSASSQDQANAIIFLRRHLDEGLNIKYLIVNTKKALKDRCNHQKTVILPRARYEWAHLRIQDFKTVAKHNSAMFRITSQFKLCGEMITEEDILEKTFSTFHASNVLLQQQYRERSFTEYNQLIFVLLVAEQHNELLMKNHQSQPTGSAPFLEVNAVSLKGNTTSSSWQ